MLGSRAIEKIEYGLGNVPQFRFPDHSELAGAPLRSTYLSEMISAHDALKRLKDGNKRYATEAHSCESFSFEKQRIDLLEGQSPFAVILGCSDSRVPAELVFDQGLGDLFVVRVAGNVAAPSQIGSVEFAVSELGTRLVVVMGHANCGAVIAALNNVQNPEGKLTPSLFRLIERIQPAVESVLAENPSTEISTLIPDIIKANVLSNLKRMRTESEVISRYEAEEGLLIVGAEYCLQTGQVEFFDPSESK